MTMEQRSTGSMRSPRSSGQYPVDYPARGGWAPRLVPLQQDLVGSVRATLLTILGAVGLCC